MDKQMKEHLEKWLSDNALTVLFAIVMLAGIAIVLVTLAYVANFYDRPISANPDRWGQFGDFWGGTLNPIFGFLSVIALLAALVIQGRELKISSAELKHSAEALQAQNRAITHQSFEQTFFAWMTTYRELLESVEITIFRREQAIEIRGRKVLSYWWNHYLSESYLLEELKRRLPINERPLVSDLGLLSDDYRPIAISITMERWEDLYGDNEYQLDNLFRVLYRLILWIDNQPNDRLSLEQKWLYVSIIRAQLSWIELVYLFFNGQTARGEKFKPFVEKYALFDNLAIESDAVLKFLRHYPPGKGGYAATAYNSDLARTNSTTIGVRVQWHYLKKKPR